MNALSSILAASTASSGSPAQLLIFIPLIGGLIYMMIVPQRKQRQKAAAFVSQLKVGDEVVTAGGIHGRITFMEDKVVHLQVDTDTVIKVSIGSISRSANEPEEPVRPTRGRTAQVGDDLADEDSTKN